MGKPGRSRARGLMCTLVLFMMLGSGLFVSPPAEAAPGDLVAPVYMDGDWWNQSWEGGHTILAKAGAYEVGFSEVDGYLRYTVDGTVSQLGKVSWVMKVNGKVQLSGDWSDGDETGSTTMLATVSGVEYRSTEDLALLGYRFTYSGDLEIATMSGPEYFDVTIYENMTMDRPLRMLLFPVPIAKLPNETHAANLRYVFESGTYSAERYESWSYRSAYMGVEDVRGSVLTFIDQNTFSVVGNVTVGESKTPIDLKLYYEKNPRKAVTIDEVRGLEVSSYQVSPAITHPDLVLASGEFNATSYNPTEGSVVNITGTVHNLGNQEVLSVNVELWASMDDDRPVRQNSTKIPSIGAYGKVTVHFNWTAAEVGQWEFFLRVDPTNTITENREDNNEASLLLIVKYDIPKPNLYVVEDGMVLDPPSPVNNRTAIKITVDVGNEGPGVANNVSVDLYMGDPGAGGIKIGWRDTIDVIPPGETRKAWINWAANVPGNLLIYAYLDSNNTVNETVETDNTGYVPLIVVATPHGEVDLVVAAIKMLDSNGLDIQPFPSGEKVKIRTTISNIEANKANRAHMSVYVDTEDPQGLVGSYEGAIDAKGLVGWEVTWTVDRPDGDHEVIVTVVAVGDVEATYNNNVGTFAFKVGPRSYPDPEPLDVTIYPDSTIVEPGQVIQVSGKVTLAKNGFEVPGATVYVVVRGQSNPVEVITNALGRYLANVTMPVKPGNYRLEAQARQALSEGDNSITITVEKDTIDNNGGSGGEDNTFMFFFVGLIVLIAVLMPVTYYILVSRAAIKRRIRHVHEEIVEIVDEEEK
jgi:hypothetical protein